MAHFPMFISIEGKPCLVAGGKRVALRKAMGLLDFGARVTLVAEEVARKDFHNMESLRIYERKFRESDLRAQEWALVVAATNDRQVNSMIGAWCRGMGVPVNVADCREECTFFFPAYCREENTVLGISTSGTSPALAKALRERAERILPQWLKEQETEK